MQCSFPDVFVWFTCTLPYASIRSGGFGAFSERAPKVLHARILVLSENLPNRIEVYRKVQVTHTKTTGMPAAPQWFSVKLPLNALLYMKMLLICNFVHLSKLITGREYPCL